LLLVVVTFTCMFTTLLLKSQMPPHNFTFHSKVEWHLTFIFLDLFTLFATLNLITPFNITHNQENFSLMFFISLEHDI
jgi:hypothetical protein